MPRPKNKEDLLTAAEANFEKLNELIDSLSEKELTTSFDFSADEKKKEAHWKRDKNVRDILIHLYEWHQLMIRFVDENTGEKSIPFLPENYNWRTIAAMNQVFWEKHQETSLANAREMLAGSHAEVMKRINCFTNEELFLSKAFPAVGNTTLGSYFISSTSSHYDWAMKKIKAHRKNSTSKLMKSKEHLGKNGKLSFDYKKEYKEFYMPKNKPQIVDVPEMRFLAVRGKGNPNDEGGEYKTAIGLLYGIAFTIKMSKKGNHKIDGYFDYVMPPLEGFWWQEDTIGVDYSRKDDFCWISVIRLPDFVTEEDFKWAVEEAGRKKGQDFSRVEFLIIQEGLCVQCMHIGAYDDEPATVEKMEQFLQKHGYVNDFSAERMHHEIYLSDGRRVAPERQKTVIRHPIKKIIE